MAIFIDGHVHIYPAFDRDSFFSAAFDNFSQAAERRQTGGENSFVLALSEGAGHDVFSELQHNAKPFESRKQEEKSPDSIHIYTTMEPNSLLVCKGGKSLTLIGGRQHVSKENIEILALGSIGVCKDRTLSLTELCDWVAASDGIVVLPWGVGKWFGRRGELITTFLETAHDYPFYVGDNGNRPSCWPAVSHFSLARQKNIPMLSGSDPLPLKSHTGRAATSGSFLAGATLSQTHPVASLRQELAKGQGIEHFGKRVGPLRFCIDQLRLRIH